MRLGRYTVREPEKVICILAGGLTRAGMSHSPQVTCLSFRNKIQDTGIPQYSVSRRIFTKLLRQKCECVYTHCGWGMTADLIMKLRENELLVKARLNGRHVVCVYVFVCVKSTVNNFKSHPPFSVVYKITIRDQNIIQTMQIRKFQ